MRRLKLGDGPSDHWLADVESIIASPSESTPTEG